jgi:hypothetical protein
LPAAVGDFPATTARRQDEAEPRVKNNRCGAVRALESVSRPEQPLRCDESDAFCAAFAKPQMLPRHGQNMRQRWCFFNTAERPMAVVDPGRFAEPVEKAAANLALAFAANVAGFYAIWILTSNSLIISMLRSLLKKQV